MTGKPGSPLLTDNLIRLQVEPACAACVESGRPESCRLAGPEEGGPQLFFEDQPVYRGDQPLQQAAAEAQSLLKDKLPDLVIFFGYGLGWHPLFLRRMTQAPIVVFDPSPDITACVLGQVPVEVQDVHLVTSRAALTDLLGSLLTPGREHLVAGALPWYREQFPEAFAEFREVLDAGQMKLKVDRATRRRFSAEWVSHLAANLPWLARSRPLTLVGEALRGKPGLFVGAGPSLDRHFAALQEAQGRALIVAAHTAVKPLAREGITPDLVVIIEGQKLDHFFTDVAGLDRMVLVPSASTHPVHLELAFKDVLSVSLEGMASADWLERAYGEKALPTGGSVACACFGIMHHLGCDPLVCVGMDMSYADGRSHALGTDLGCCDATTDEARGLTSTHCREGYHRDLEYPTSMVTAWGGNGQVASREHWSSIRHWFEIAARDWLGARQLINANETGARIRGFEERPLDEVVAGFPPPFGPATIIAERTAAGPAHDPRFLRDAVEGELEIIRQAGLVAEAAEALGQKAIAKLKSRQLNTVQPLLDELARKERDLQELTRKTRLLNTLVGHRAQDMAAHQATGDELARTIGSVKISRQISDLVVNGAQELKELFEPVLAQLDPDKEVDA